MIEKKKTSGGSCRNGVVSFVIPAEENRLLKAAASKKGITKSELCRNVMYQWLVGSCPGDQPLTIRISGNLLTRMQIAAAEKNESVSLWARKALEKAARERNSKA
ncbi:MAG: hypothetical protein U0K19_02895 [Bifidobacteriaceae bacterium]|nr:hypothetical protein [Bifidobacteriaceae bacterium]